jgi:hypothetical protein
MMQLRARSPQRCSNKLLCFRSATGKGATLGLLIKPNFLWPLECCFGWSLFRKEDILLALSYLPVRKL